MCVCVMCGVKYVYGVNACVFVCGVYKYVVRMCMCGMCVVCTRVWHMSRAIVWGKGEEEGLSLPNSESSGNRIKANILLLPTK